VAWLASASTTQAVAVRAWTDNRWAMKRFTMAIMQFLI
jgi:hypothetical protein